MPMTETGAPAGGIPCAAQHRPASPATSANRDKGPRQKKRKQGREFDWDKAKFGKYALKIAYVGTRYHGLAWQDPVACPNCPTIESTLFEMLVKTRLIKDRESSCYSRCGRTDKGVHSAGNYVALLLRKKSDDEDFDYPTMLNNLLPPDIRIIAATPVPAEFDARFSCSYRAYQYYFPLQGENLARMREAAEYFVGEHDFRNFCKMDVENVSNFRRTIHSVRVAEVPGCGTGEFAVTGQAFLWHQVRCMVAVLLLVGAGQEEPDLVKHLLDVEQMPRKPIYELADESGLILRDCGFQDLPIAPGIPAPPAGQTPAMPAGLANEVAITGLRQMLAQARREASVKSCLLAAAVGADGGIEGALQMSPSCRKARHTPLLQRARCPSLEEKLEAFEARKQRKNGDQHEPQETKTVTATPPAEGDTVPE